MDRILVLDFGGQYDLLIARRVREHHVFAEIKPYGKISAEEVKRGGYRGIIFTGGPASVYAEGSPLCGADMLETGIPVLGICYGAQLIAHLSGGEVSPAEGSGEYGSAALSVGKSALFEGIPEKITCWMSHSDRITSLPPGYTVTASTGKCPAAAFENSEKKIYGVQFHPEVSHTEYGRYVIGNFVKKICGASGDWTMDGFTERSVRELREKLEGRNVMLALSGGVDSSVAAELLCRAVGDRLTCVFVDHGMLRKGESEAVVSVFGGRKDMNFIRVDAAERFLERLSGVTEPETKRRIIGEEFIRVFEETAKACGGSDVLAQGTIYPDVIESGRGDAAVIKSHHNVGGLPGEMLFREICEPLRDLFKDEVRHVGELLGLPDSIVRRQPFPGPGLAVRITGRISGDKLNTVREADAIFREEVGKLPEEERPSQYFAVLTDTKSVGVKGDARAYGYTVALRAVDTDDFMTAGWSRLPYSLLETASGRITGEIPQVTRVVYDITSKPPATVEWE